MVSKNVNLQIDGNRFQAEAQFNLNEWSAPPEAVGRFVRFSESSELWVEFMLGTVPQNDSHLMYVGNDGYRFKITDKDSKAFLAVHMSVNPLTGKQGFR